MKHRPLRQRGAHPIGGPAGFGIKAAGQSSPECSRRRYSCADLTEYPRSSKVGATPTTRE
jgi:hypothetical protein